MELARFRREEHLKRRKEIREVFGKGKQYSCLGAKLFVLKNDLPINRICFTFSKGKGFKSAVARNRARRLGREAFRLMKCRLKNGYDLILLVYPESGGGGGGTPPPVRGAALSDRERQLDSLFTKAGLLK